QEGIAVQRTGERNSLPLACRQGCAVVADLRFVALRHTAAHFVSLSATDGSDDALRLRVRLEAGDVLRNRSAHQFNILWQIADMRSERGGRPLVKRGPVHPDRAARRRPYPDQRARE